MTEFKSRLGSGSVAEALRILENDEFKYIKELYATPAGRVKIDALFNTPEDQEWLKAHMGRVLTRAEEADTDALIARG